MSSALNVVRRILLQSKSHTGILSVPKLNREYTMTSTVQQCEHGKIHCKEAPCQQCLDLGDMEVANMKLWQHFTDIFKDLLFFKFSHVIIDIIWLIQKLTGTGDFGPQGYFAKRGYWKNGEPTEK